MSKKRNQRVGSSNGDTLTSSHLLSVPKFFAGGKIKPGHRLSGGVHAQPAPLVRKFHQ